MEMLIQYPELAQRYVISPIIRPLAKTTERQGSCEICSYATEGISIVMVGWLWSNKELNCVFFARTKG